MYRRHIKQTGHQPCTYVAAGMYVHIVTHTARVRINTGKVANPARRQLNRENEYFPVPFAPENLVSRDGFGSPVPRQPPHLHHTQAAFMDQPVKVANSARGQLNRENKK